MNAEFQALIRNRRAVRKFTDQPVTRQQIESLLEAANWAPSAHNRRPWRFAVVAAAAEKDRLARALGNQLAQARRADDDSPAAIDRDVTRSYNRITAAPVIIVVCLSMIEMDTYPDAVRNRAEWVMAVQSVSMAAQTMWLAAHAQGLAMGWLCAPLFAPGTVRQSLGLPADWEPLGLMPLGYAAEQPQKERDPLDNKVIWK